MPLTGTANFTPAELLAVSSANPPAAVLDNGQRMCVALEALRGQILAPMILTSWYRNAADNAATPGSVSDSDHLDGDGADFVVPSLDHETVNVAIQAAIDNGLVPDVRVVLDETDHWHVSLKKNSAHPSLPPRLEHWRPSSSS